jgi:hypothetical protein
MILYIMSFGKVGRFEEGDGASGEGLSIEGGDPNGIAEGYGVSASSSARGLHATYLLFRHSIAFIGDFVPLALLSSHDQIGRRSK